MTLKELQEMIKEEFQAFQNEAEDDVDVSVSDADVDVDAEMGDAEEGETDEDILRNIYDMLKAKFEAEDDMGDDMGDEEGAEDVEDVDEIGIGGGISIGEDGEEEEMMEEGDGYDGPTKGSSGKDSGMKPVSKGSTKGAPYTASSKALQERFQKLANIIK